MSSLRAETCTHGPPPLDGDAVTELIASVEGWQVEDGHLVRSYAFENFAAAMRFVNHVAEVAESQNHHPDILIHGWRFVRLTLITHDVGGAPPRQAALTRNDFITAARIDG